MADPAGEYRLLKDEIDAAVSRVLASGRYVLGPEGEALEGEVASYVGARYAVGCNSGTDALHLPLVAADIGRGDAIREALARDGIAASIFYPTPLHRQPAYEAANRDTSFPEAEAASKAVLSLPIHPQLDYGSVDRICARVEAALA